MRWLQNISFPSSSSSAPPQPSPGSASSSPTKKDRRGGGGGGGGGAARFGRRLTRQVNLRYLSDQEIDGALQLPPPSPDGSSPAAAVAHPLPLPELALLLRRKEGFSGAGAERGDCPLPSPEEAGVSRDREGDAGGDGPGPAARVGCSLAYQNGNEVVENVDAGPSTAVCLDVRGVERSGDNFRLNVPTRSVPTSPFISPALSPQRKSLGDLLPYYLTPRGNNTWSAPEMPIGSPSPSFLEHNGSPLPSPQTKTPRRSSKSSWGSASPMHHKSSVENSTAWRESNVQAGVHPLPRPPGAALPSHSPPNAQVTVKAESLPLKSQWKKGRLIGRGTFGSVYVASNRETGALCAMKEVELLPDDPKSAECMRQLEQEIKVLSRLKHPNIVQYYGSEIVEDRFYIYLEYVHPGSINKYVRDHCGAITESVVRNFTRHILSGLAYLHSKKTIHRDIKGANLLVDASGIVKLADFGMAKHLTGQTADLSLKGSPYWMAPELIQAVMQKDNGSDHALAVDIWSLGCTIVEMLTGKPPWSGFEGAAAMFKAMNNSPSIPEILSSEGKDFLQRCFRRDPAERPSAAMLLEHPFLKSSQQIDVPSHTQVLSRKSTDLSHSPRDHVKHTVDKLPILPTAAQSTAFKAVIDSEGGRQSHVETSDLTLVSRYSPRSILEVLPTLSPPHSDRTANYPSPSSNRLSSVKSGAKKNRLSR
ncbi:mitogen-activated protein kinase kinase kinase 5 isoform X1 [Syzygium oleosum]|uniref:mitogen-activated protein kinase kinase kinase 5 isoform X1 n=1 Tax=Syzygium oleosum TaxID=219896 RepID=UPI0024B99314|nr:mitogen-activated protein kinase kinase kinase 5 isoform X1 [Syzygium oleosum]XP_056169928.1 mitogen-activated protein kinase kinase kinase 5 isoform X1 [Syzygium oleosum]XP_056169929.1 mitogen-activated protein kinase kinase kinase 5 isoform X1 [Syzygium oleosum]